MIQTIEDVSAAAKSRLGFVCGWRSPAAVNSSACTATPTPAPPAPTTATGDQGLEVEVFTSFVHVSDAMWKSFEQPGVRLACS